MWNATSVTALHARSTFIFAETHARSHISPRIGGHIGHAELI